MKLSPSIRSIRQRSVPILRRYGVRKAAVFGSFARGEERKKSDVDFLMDIPKEMSLFDLVGLQLDLEEKLGRKVDVVTYPYIKPYLKKRILDEQIPIYEKRSKCLSD